MTRMDSVVLRSSNIVTMASLSTCLPHSLSNRRRWFWRNASNSSQLICLRLKSNRVHRLNRKWRLSRVCWTLTCSARRNPRHRSNSNKCPRFKLGRLCLEATRWRVMVQQVSRRCTHSTISSRLTRVSDQLSAHCLANLRSNSSHSHRRVKRTE